MKVQSRLSSGGIIDRTRPLRFTFNGKSFSGFEGDTLASALLANDVYPVARSLKYHRPRGIMAHGSEDPCALVGLNSGAQAEPNSRVTQIALSNGLSARSLNCWPSVGFDMFRIIEKLARFIGAGFYYKTFMWPEGSWLFYENLIRKAAGFGKAPSGMDSNHYEKQHLQADVLVIGAGPSGLAAATSAVISGAKTLLVDEHAHPGGSLLDDQATINGMPGQLWAEQAISELNRHGNFTCLSSSTAFGIYDHNLVGIIERGSNKPPSQNTNSFRFRLWKVRARQIILATGSLERMLVFENNDRPGIMLANAVRSYLHRYAVLPGQQAVIFTNNDNAYRTALDLNNNGIKVNGIIDLRTVTDSALVRQARNADIPIHFRHCVINTSGSRRINGVTIAGLDSRNKPDFSTWIQLPCDLLCASGGHVPAVQLHSHVAGPLEFNDQYGAHVPASDQPSIRSVGGCKGEFSFTACLNGGASAGAAAAIAAGLSGSQSIVKFEVHETEEALDTYTWFVPETLNSRKCFVDYQNDVTVNDIRQTVQEGYRSIEHVKRYTALNMGTDQGKIGALTGTAIVASELGIPLRDVGTTTYRPPYIPVSIGALIGSDAATNTYPTRHTAVYQWHVDNNGLFSAGPGWKRPDVYPRTGETVEAAIKREAVAVRSAVGIMDVSTVGKFELQGPDVARFIDRIWVNDWHNTSMGRGKYWVMLRDDGIIFDDGIAVRLGDNHFFVTSTSANQDRFYERLEYLLQTQWPNLQVMVTPVGEQWFTLALSGPRARDLLAKASSNLDVTNKAFPIISIREAPVCEIPARIIRMSFCGELCYEISVPADYGLQLWEALLKIGETDGIMPYGLEAANILRIEKGHFIIGHDADGRTSIADMGMEKMIGRSKHFIGKPALELPGMASDDRMQYVGLVIDEQTVKQFPRGAVLSEPGRGNPFLGKVTSACWSYELNKPISLGLLRQGRSRIGETLEALSPMTDEYVPVRVTGPVFYDKENARSHG